MGFSARILLDSISPAGVRLTTMEVRYPRFIHSELMTHRVFSRNSASSRAIPIRKMIDATRAEPAMPMWWGRNQAGMQAREPLDPASQALAESEWRKALDDALAHAERLAATDINLHKQLVNRILEPFAWITVIITATEWANFFTQRTHEDAQPELKHIADLMLAAYRAGVPQPLALDDWHTPLILPEELSSLTPDRRRQISVARCARVSYLSHDGTRDLEKDLQLYTRLAEGGANGHWSPFEHVATPLADAEAWSGNFRGWEQFRKRFAQEDVTTLPDEATVAVTR
jgi:thymidylate synthase ThyX